MKHIYINGSVVNEVTEELAKEMVANGAWYVCTTSWLLHTIAASMEGPGIVYHYRGGFVR